jgi:hypothetical protein
MAAYGRTAGIADFHYIRRQHPQFRRWSRDVSGNKDLTIEYPQPQKKIVRSLTTYHGQPTCSKPVKVTIQLP